jgi:TolB-like protein/Tfp pilus assembly protein PilF
MPLVGLVTVVAASAVVIALLKPWDGGRGAGPSADDERSLAVLPFTSVGGDTANSYFAAGIADELTSALSRIPGLRLAGRASAARVKHQGDGAGDIGKSLNVSAVLDGSVRRAGERIRVVAELTSAADGRVLWSETYERALEDVFAVQDDITRSIVGALQVRLASGDVVAAAGARGGTSDLAAYDHYLRALERYRGRGAGLLDAERSLMAAVAADPAYAKAHALLASVLLVQPTYVDIDGSAVQRRARAAAQRAVALDDSLADGHIALGHVHAESFEWVDAERELRRAIALDPRSVEAHFRLAETLTHIGRLRDARIPMEEALRLDPLYPVAAGFVSWTSSMLGRHNEAVNESRRALALDPENPALYFHHCTVLDAAGQHAEAAVQARILLGMTTDPARAGFAGWVLARAGATGEARAILRRLRSMPGGTRGRSLGLVNATLGLGDVEGALDALEVAVVEAPQRLVAHGLTATRFDLIRAEPRFAAVLRRLNLDVEHFTLPDGGRSR